MDNLGALNVFVRAAGNRSFTQTGKQLGISSSAVGKAIARLEERLGVRLFHRSTRSITLTTEGGLFLDRCQRIFCEIEAAEQELAHIKEAPRGRLRVSMPIAGALLMPVLTDFMRSYPDIQLDLDFTDQMVDVIEDGFDAVIRGAPVSDSRLMTRKLGDFELVIAASPDYLRQNGIPETPHDLSTHACLHHRFAGTGKLEPWPLRHNGKGIDVDIPQTAIVNTVEPLIHLAEEGMGIACLPKFSIRKQLESGSLTIILEECVSQDSHVHLLWPTSQYISPKLRVFIDFMAANLFSRRY